MYPSPTQLAEQLSVLVEADLGFKATAGLHHAWPNVARNESGQALPQHGFLNLMLALDAVIDGAGPSRGGRAPRAGRTRFRIAEAISSWDDARQQRVRRRLRSFGCCGVTDPVQDLVALDLLEQPDMSWFEPAANAPFGVDELPYGIYRTADAPPTVGVARRRTR